MTPSGLGSAGGIAIVHDKELILDQDDTKNMLKAIDMTRSLVKYTNLASVPLSKSTSTNQANNRPMISMPIHIDKIIGDEDGANTVFKDIKDGMSGMGIILKP
ncbi:hypothetical protein ACIQLG_03915 [Terribacillus saccharophilus]|uniref:hypothetical protein n=1 Tax=Terribacillus saccharophilus TaxID=361277 RepID=UPI0038064238